MVTIYSRRFLIVGLLNEIDNRLIIDRNCKPYIQIRGSIVKLLPFVHRKIYNIVYCV